MQCGRDVAADKNGLMGKLVRLRVSKRVVRIPDSTQCFEYPVDVPLPRPRIIWYNDPVRNIKSVPLFYRRYIRHCDLFATAAAASADEIGYRNSYQSDDDVVVISDLLEKINHNVDGGNDNDDSIFKIDHMPYDNETTLTPLKEKCSEWNNNKNNQNKLENQMISEERVESTDVLQYPNDFIHYCLFIFHGIYNPNRMLELVGPKEFRVRILMLNYRIREAFQLCISDVKLPRQAIRTFEYFTKDANVIPIHREDLKFLIYELFLHFIVDDGENDSPSSVGEIERFFMADLDYYLFALAYVLYFNNNNSDIERLALTKYAELFGDDVKYADIEMMEKSEVIFNAVSVAFKTTVCQKLFEYEDNFA